MNKDSINNQEEQNRYIKRQDDGMFAKGTIWWDEGKMSKYISNYYRLRNAMPKVAVVNKLELDSNDQPTDSYDLIGNRVRKVGNRLHSKKLGYLVPYTKNP